MALLAFLASAVAGPEVLPSAAAAAATEPRPVLLAQTNRRPPQTGDIRADSPFAISLTRLVQTYGCTAGYPDATFRYASTLTRYEFAGLLNACLESLQAGVAAAGVRQDQLDLTTLRRAFGPELRLVRQRSDQLQPRGTPPGVVGSPRAPEQF